MFWLHRVGWSMYCWSGLESPNCVLEVLVLGISDKPAYKVYLHVKVCEVSTITVKVILKEDDITFVVVIFLFVCFKAAVYGLDLWIVRSVVLCCVFLWNIFGEKQFRTLPVCVLDCRWNCWHVSCDKFRCSKQHISFDKYLLVAICYTAKCGRVMVQNNCFQWGIVWLGNIG